MKSYQKAEERTIWPGDYISPKIMIIAGIVIVVIVSFITTLAILGCLDKAFPANFPGAPCEISSQPIEEQVIWDTARMFAPDGQSFKSILHFEIVLIILIIASSYVPYKLTRSESEFENSFDVQDDKSFGYTMARQGITPDDIITSKGVRGMWVVKAILFLFLFIPSLSFAADACKCCPPVGLDNVYEECFLQYNSITDSIHLIRLDGTVAATLRNPSKEVESLV